MSKVNTVIALALLCISVTAYAEVPGEISETSPAAPASETNDQEFPKRELLFFEEVPIVISATKREQPITQSPSSISVITAEEISRSSATNIADLLRRVPGLDVLRITPSDANISARGFNEPSNNDVLLLIDGRSAYVDFFGIVVWDDLPIVLEEIERIEIIRGPGSALYGANAFSGVINIITKSPEQLEGTTLSATAGEYDTAILSFINADVLDKWSYKVVAGWDEASSFDYDENDHRLFKGNFLINYDFDPESRIYFSAGGTNGTGNTLTRVASFDREGTLGGYAKLNYDYENWKFQTFYNLIDIDVMAEDDENERSIINNVLDFELQHSLYPWEKHIVTWGTNYRFNSVTSHEIIGNKEEENMFSLFVQDQYKLLDDMTLTAGIRFDSHPLTGIHLSPRASVVYEPWEGHIFRASVARAFRNPSFIESFLDLVIIDPPVTVVSQGDTDLEAEEITSFEIGYQTRLLGNRLDFKVDTFFNMLDEIIEFHRTAPPPDIKLEYFNAGKANAYGGEISLTYRFTNWLSSYANYSYQELEARSDEVQFQLNEKGEEIESSPNHKFNAGLYVGLESGWNAAVELNLVSETTFGFLDRAAGFEPTEVELDSYNRLDTRIGYKFPNHDIEASLIIHNALNDVHQEFPTGEDLKRKVLLQVIGRF